MLVLHAFVDVSGVGGVGGVGVVAGVGIVTTSEAIIAKRYSLFKGPAECAKRSAAQPGWRAKSFYQVFLALLQISFK